MGSNIAVKKAPVDIMAKATDTVDTLIAQKKVTQCEATTIPAKVNHNMVLPDTRSLNLENRMYIRMKIVASPMRYHTSDRESIEISFPKMAVKPYIKTIT